MSTDNLSELSMSISQISDERDIGFFGVKAVPIIAIFLNITLLE